jgi:hypothetical protein
MGDDGPLELRPGCIHQAWDQAFTSLAHVWPSTTPDHWWVDVNQACDEDRCRILNVRRVSSQCGEGGADQWAADRWSGSAPGG